MSEADLMGGAQVLLTGVAVGHPNLRAVIAQDRLRDLLRRAAISCSTPVLETNTHGHCVAPSIRAVVSSEPITRLVRRRSLITARAISKGSPARRSALAIAPSDTARPKNSRIIRDSRSQPTWWL